MSRPFGKTYGDLWLHPKWMTLPGAARGLWASGLSYSVSMRTFGSIEAHLLPVLGGTPEDAAALVAAGLWDETSKGWQMHDWDDHQTSREKFEEVSAKRRASGRLGGLARSKGAVTSGDKQSAKQVGKQTGSKSEASAKHTEAPASKPKLEVEVEVEVEEELTPHSPPEGGGEDAGLFALEEPKPTRRKTGVYSDEFETAWAAFPKYGRQAKKVAAEAYDRALERADAATILAGIERYSAYVEQTDVKCKYMQGWLNADRWEDENAVQPYRNGFNRPTAEENVRAAYGVAQFYAQQEQQEVSAGPNRRLSA